jgi:hypothetical protein
VRRRLRQISIVSTPTRMIVSSPGLSFVTQWERLAVGVNKLAVHGTIMVAESGIKFWHVHPFPAVSQFPPKKRPRFSNCHVVKVRTLCVEESGDVSIFLVVS